MDAKTITIGRLRQNPTEMIRAVRAGETWVLTDRGMPVADIVPHREGPWRPVDEIVEMLRAIGPDPEWAGELDRWRAETTIDDPWERP